MYQADFLQGAQAGALEHDYLLSYCSPPASLLPNFLQRLENSPVRGILSGAYGDLNTKLPTVYVDRVPKASSDAVYTVTCNNYQGGYEMMKQLLERGHRNIVIFFRRELMPERLTGFRDAMMEAGISDWEKRTFFWLDESRYEAQKNLRQALKKFAGFTAIACGSDPQMFLTADALDQQGLAWRNRIALTGFGNLAYAGDFLRLPGVEQHPEEIGAQGVGELLRMIADPEYAPERLIEIETELVNLEKLPRPPR